MDQQARYNAQSTNTMFADTRAARPQVEGTVARGRLDVDAALNLGQHDGRWITAMPVPVTDRLMRRGQERFNIYCAPCHGMDGTGAGIVAKRADRLQEGTWVPPSNLHDATVRDRPIGHLFNTITNGIRNMPPYGAQIGVEDRWAVVAYVRALQRSRNATIEDVPAEMRTTLR
jgi:mono/diheme cytochrome c family protein